MHAKSLQSYPTLCNPTDYSLPGSSVHGILQERILDWISMIFLRKIFPTHGPNLCLLCLLHWQMCSLPLAPPEKPFLKSLYHLTLPPAKYEDIPYHPQDLIMSVFLEYSYSDGCVVRSRIFNLHFNTVEHLSIWRLAIHIPFLVKCLFGYFIHFELGSLSSYQVFFSF